MKLQQKLGLNQKNVAKQNFARKMRKARCFISRKKQVFLVDFSAEFPIFPRISKNQPNISLMSLVLCTSRNVSFNDDNHILKFFNEGFENLPSSFFFNSENLLSNIKQCTWLHLYFPFGKLPLDIRNKMEDDNGTALPHETDFDISKDRFC